MNSIQIQYAEKLIQDLLIFSQDTMGIAVQYLPKTGFHLPVIELFHQINSDFAVLDNASQVNKIAQMRLETIQTIQWRIQHGEKPFWESLPDNGFQNLNQENDAEIIFGNLVSLRIIAQNDFWEPESTLAPIITKLTAEIYQVHSTSNQISISPDNTCHFSQFRIAIQARDSSRILECTDWLRPAIENTPISD